MHLTLAFVSTLSLRGDLHGTGCSGIRRSGVSDPTHV